MQKEVIENKKQEIQKDIENNAVMLYMKGEPAMPQCGFSAQVIQILNQYDCQYETRNVLADEVLRQAIKEFSDWPTIPQLYAKQEFVGGCDIVMELHRTGELKTILSV